MWRVLVLVGASGCALINAAKGDGSAELTGCAGGGTSPSFRLSTITFVPQAAAIGDFNGDGMVDLAFVHDAVVQAAIASGPIQPGNEHLALGATTAIDPGPATDMAVADFDGDGRDDLAVLVGGEVQILFGGADGHFTLVDTFTDLPASAIAAGPLYDAGDATLHKTLVVVGMVPAMSMRRLFWNGASFMVETDEALADPVSVAMGDLDGDGKPEVAYSHSGDGIGIRLGSTGASPAFISTTEPFPQVLIGHGNDVLAIQSLSDAVVVTRDVFANMSFQRTVNGKLTGGIVSHGLARLADVHGDHQDELVIPGLQHNGAGGISNVFQVSGLAGSSPCLSFPGTDAPVATHYIATGDLDKNGKTDLVVLDEGGGATVFPN